MEQSVYELLRRCTARVSILGKSGHGTGFFVAPGFLLTCAHVVKSAQSPSNEVQVFWNQHPHAARIAKIDFDADLALLHIDLTGHPCVFLTKEALPFDSLYSYGYPDTNPAGDPTTFLLEGKSGDQGERLKFKAGQVRPGQSGAPLLNINSGYVCGIVQLTRGRASDLGGRAIPTTTVFQVFPELEALQRQYHRNDQHWMNSLWAYTTRTLQGKERQWMLKRVRTFWITDFLEKSLYNASLIALGLQEKPSLVDNRWRLVMQESGRPERLLPPGTSITEIYDSSEGELLILGEPGSGKTTLLLELARDLLERARLDHHQPIPVIFNLSSWATEQKPLTDWFIKELNTRYQVPLKLGKLWVEKDHLLFLLDGLDEVAPASRVACVNALNLYRQTHGLVPVVVCSRRAEYLTEASKVQLRSAVIVQPLTRQQIDKYVSSAAGQLEAVRQALLDDASLQELVETPLMLSTLALAYQGESIENLLAQPSLPARRRKVFEKYVERVLSRRQISTRYTPEQTVHWLSWLARQMRKQNQSTFTIELLQPYWLPKQPRIGYRWSVGLLFGLIAGLFSGLLFGLIGSSYGQPVGLVVGLISGGVGALAAGETVGRAKEIKFSERITWRDNRSSLLFTLFGGLTERKQRHESLWEKLRRAFRGWLVAGLVIGLLLGLIAGLIFLPFGLLTALGVVMGAGIVGLFFWMAIGLVILLVQGLDKGLDTLQRRTGERLLRRFGGEDWMQHIEFHILFPQERLRRAFKSGLVVGLVIGLSSVLINGLFSGTISGQFSLLIARLVSGLLPELVTKVVTWTVDGLIFGLILGLLFGSVAAVMTGEAVKVVQHLLLRIWLWQAGLFPLRARIFLNDTSNRILLQRIGGSYQFIHRLLLDYFTDLDDTVPPTAGPTVTPIVSVPTPISKHEKRQPEVLTITKQADQPDPTDEAILVYLRKLEEALAVTEQAIQLDPTDARAYNNKGLALIDLKRYKEALVAFDHALDLEPNYALAYRYKGVSLNNLKCYEEALDSLEESIRLDPTDALAYNNKNIALHQLHRNEEALMASEQALIVAEEAIRLNPKDAAAYRSKGFALTDLKLYKEALKAYEQAIHLDSTRALVYSNKGFVLSEFQRYEEALAAYEQAIRLDPTNANEYYGKGVALERLGQYEEALASFEQAIHLDPSFTFAYLGKGTALLNLKRLEEALEAYEQAIRLDPNSVLAYHNKGIVLRGLERYAEAVIAYEQVIHLDSNNPLRYNEKGFILERLQQYKEALVAYEEAIRLDPNNTRSYLNKGNILTHLGRYEEALAAYEQAIRLDPTNASIHNDKGDVLTLLARFKEALTTYEQAIRLNPNGAYAYFGKGQVLFNLARHKKALLAYEQAIGLDPDYAPMHNRKGVALEKLKRYEEALEAYDQAMRLDPNEALYYYNKGNILSNLKQYEGMLGAFEQAIILDSSSAYAFYSKGIALEKLRRYEEALTAYDQTIHLDPNYVHAYRNKGDVLVALARYEEALTTYEQAIHLDPKYALMYLRKGDVLKVLGRNKEAQVAYSAARALKS